MAGWGYSYKYIKQHNNNNYKHKHLNCCEDVFMLRKNVIFNFILWEKICISTELIPLPYLIKNILSKLNVVIVNAGCLR